jgi:hypothetical protein
MKYAITVTHDGQQYALVKTDNYERVEVIAALCAMHMEKLYPGAICEISTDRSRNTMVEMHPDKDWIIDKLRGYEFPLPHEVIIDGVFKRT